MCTMHSDDSSSTATNQLRRQGGRSGASPLLEQLVTGYERTKHSCGLFERTLEAVEKRVQVAVTLVLHIYLHYCQPQVNAIRSAYGKGVEGTKHAMEVTRNVAVTTSTYGIGATVLCAELSLALGTAGASFLLDCAIATKHIGTNLAASAKVYGEVVEKHVAGYIHQAHDAVQEPLKDLFVQANSFLDMADAAVDKMFGLLPEPRPADAFLGERAMGLIIRVYSALVNRAVGEFIDPLYVQLHSVADELNKSVLLADLIRERKSWAKEKVDEWHASINELKERIEKEAALLKLSPEELLMNSIRHSSAQLSGELIALRQKGTQVLSEPALATLEAAVAYLEKMDVHFGEATDLYKLRDEVLCEAQSKLSELVQWTSKWLDIGDDAWDFRESSPPQFDRAIFVIPARLPTIAGGA